MLSEESEDFRRRLEVRLDGGIHFWMEFRY